MRVLITRPRDDATALAERLADQGIETLIEPMFDVVNLPSGAPGLHGVQAILLTSANGARALAAMSTVRWVPVLAVGDATARAAREVGFIKVESADGDVETLARLAVERLDPKAGKLVHVAGTTVAGDLAGSLTAAGFTVERAVLYEARARQTLSPDTAAALRDGTVDGVLFFSPRTATTFVTVAGAAGLTESCRGLVAFCLSGAVADAARSVRWRAVSVAARPTQDALLASITSAAGAAAQSSSKPEEDPDMSDDGNSEDKPKAAADGPPESAARPTGKSAADIVQLFGGIRPMAHKLGIAVTTVQGWKERGVIPAARHEQVLGAARDHGLVLEAADLSAPAGKPAPSKPPPPQTTAAQPPPAERPQAQSPPAQIRQPQTSESRPPPEPASGPAATESPQAPQPRPASSPERASVPPSSTSTEKQPAPKAPDPAVSTPSAKPPTERSGGSVPPASTKAKTPPPKKKSGVSPVLAFAVIAVLVAGGGYVWWQVNSSDEPVQTAVAPDDSTAGDGVDSQPAPAAGESSVAAQPEDAATGDAASTAPSAPPTDSDDAPATETAEASAPAPSAPAATPGIDEAALDAALASRDAEIAVLRSRTERLTAALEAATTRLAAVERKAAERPPAIVSSGDPRAAGLVLAVGLLREALRGSDAFAAELETLRALAAEDPEIAAALSPIEARAAAGVPTKAQLRSRFTEVAKAVVRAGTLPADPGWMDRVTHQLATLVSVRRTGPDVAGDTAEARVARAEAAVSDGNLRATVETMAGLEGAAAAAAESWLADAKARLAADDAMKRLQGLVVGRLSPASGETTGAEPSTGDPATDG